MSDMIIAMQPSDSNLKSPRILLLTFSISILPGPFNKNSNAASESSLTDLEAEPTSESGFSQALGSESYILGAIPGTSHADSSCSLLSPDLHSKLPQIELHCQVSTVSYIDTPSAVSVTIAHSFLCFIHQCFPFILHPVNYSSPASCIPFSYLVLPL